MIVSSENVKRFLLEVIEQAAFPGKMVEFVAAVKGEISAAEIDDAYRRRVEMEFIAAMQNKGVDAAVFEEYRRQISQGY